MLVLEVFTQVLLPILLDIGYAGYVGQEFIPTRDKVASLAQGVRICDV